MTVIKDHLQLPDQSFAQGELLAPIIYVDQTLGHIIL